MQTSRVAASALFPLLLALSPACGGSTSDDLAGTSPASAGGGTGSATGGSGGQQAGGTSSAGGAGSGQAGSGQSGNGQAGGGQGGQGIAGQGQAGSGTAGSGQSGNGQAGSGQSGNGQAGSGQAGSGQAGSGQAGSGQAGAGGVPDCAPPEDPTKSALCVNFVPESIDLVADDETLDGQGVMYLAAYDTPYPDGKDGMPGAQALAVALWPPQAATGQQGGISEVPTLRLTNLPASVYVRAFFFDNQQALASKQISWGVWLGGSDLSAGAHDPLPIQKVDLVAGQSAGISMPLTALRKLSVTLSVAPGVVPFDDAQGPLQWAAFDGPSPGMGAATFGVGGPRCSDLSGGKQVTISGFVFGAGQRWIAANLDDFNTGNTQPGSLFTADFSSGSFAIPDSDRIEVAPTSYRQAMDVQLNLPIPLSGPKPPSYQCP